MHIVAIKSWFIFFFIVLLTLSCSELNRKKYGSTEGGGINDGFTPSENPSAIPIFPHSEEWRSLHGKWTSENGREACFKCHTKEGSDKPGSVPGCFSCHKGYPHLEPSEWDVFTGHGQTAKEAGVDSCKLCHGADLTTMKQGKNCFSCHPSFPHKLFSPDPSWEAAHGRYVLSRSIEECQTCHGTTNNDRRNPSCIGCHPFNYPHANDWLKTRGEIQPHGEYVKEHTSASCARAACHGTNLIPEANITKGPACNNATCHGATFPHTSTWRSEHGGYVLSNTPESCKSCHGADLRGTRNNPSCHNTACHETFPHTADWVSPRGGIQPHGEYVKTHESEFRQTCGKARCHGTHLDARGQAGGPSCYNAQCHGPVFLHSETWNQDHRSYVLDNTPNGCRTCHGNNFQGGPRNNPSCYPCHPFSYPHQEGWANPRGQSQPHGDTVNRDSSATCARAECHGVNLVPSAGVTKGPDCSSTGCHTDPYPHSSNFASGTNHGPAARLNINACRACHGNNLDQAPTGYRSCINCHPSISEHNLVTGTAD